MPWETSVDHPDLNRAAVELYMRHGAIRGPTIVFCESKQHIESQMAMFRRRGIDARSISHVTPQARKDMLAQFRRGDFPVIMNCFLLAEGVDIPQVCEFPSPTPLVR